MWANYKYCRIFIVLKISLINWYDHCYIYIPNNIIIWNDQVTVIEMNGNADRLLSPGITDVPGVP